MEEKMLRRRRTVDLFGEAVQSTITSGDHYRKRHDAFKMRLFQMCQWAGLDAEVEVFNLLAGSIPQEGLSRMERGRKVQSIVPDMRITIPEEGNFVQRLHENNQQLKDTVHPPSPRTGSNTGSGQASKRVKP